MGQADENGDGVIILILDYILDINILPSFSPPALQIVAATLDAVVTDGFVVPFTGRLLEDFLVLLLLGVIHAAGCGVAAGTSMSVWVEEIVVTTCLSVSLLGAKVTGACIVLSEGKSLSFF